MEVSNCQNTTNIDQIKATFRVLDWFFYVGHIGLMQIALAIFKILSKSILEMTDQVDISLLLKDELTLIEANELLSVSHYVILYFLPIIGC